MNANAQDSGNEQTVGGGDYVNRFSWKSLRKNSGFSIIELITVLFIIFLFLAIASPALQSAREGMRSLQCKRNIQQVCLGLLNYESANRCFPAGTSGFADVIDFDQANPNSFLAPDSPVFWKKAQFASFWIQILPYVDQLAIFESLPPSMTSNNRLFADSYPNGTPYSWIGEDPSVKSAMSNSFSLLFCPSDAMDDGIGPTNLAEMARQPAFDSSSGKDGYLAATIQRKDTVFGTNFVGCAGAHSGGDVADSKMSAFRGALGSKSRVRSGDIGDGHSNTLIVGEYLGAISHRKRIGGPVWCFGTIARGRGHLPWGSGQSNENGYLFGDPIDSSLAGFGSAHTNYINVGLADGSVRTVSKSIDLLTWYAICGIDDDNPVNFQSNE